MKKPTKFLIYLNAVTATLYVATAVLLALAGKPWWYPAIWLAGAGLWIFATIMQVKAHRYRIETYAYWQKRWGAR